MEIEDDTGDSTPPYFLKWTRWGYWNGGPRGPVVRTLPLNAVVRMRFQMTGSLPRGVLCYLAACV